MDFLEGKEERLQGVRPKFRCGSRTLEMDEKGETRPCLPAENKKKRGCKGAPLEMNKERE